ncbi:hypothetical protein F511_38039 [Dorcoceras hygrometricum]|uniref:Uncharacterized protein n=1 Tax=Dorcoceras hygrometricum TaxID=472368 RepID=A0A2Z7B472_9LAMI|nr:hypothetical protein F511_38039 [Dorcoceras hygrometricum]
MQMLCMRNRATAEGYNHSREPKNSGIDQQLTTDSAKIVATGPSNADPPPTKPTQATTQGPKHRKATAGSYELNQHYPTSSNLAESSKQHERGSEHLPQQARMEILTDYTREMSSHTSPASRKRPKAISKRSVSARGVQHYHSYFNWSCLPSAIKEDKQRNIRSLTQLKLTQLTAESSSLIQNAVVPTNPSDDVPTNPNDDVNYSLLKHASALSTAQRQLISLRVLNTTTQRPLLTSPLLNAGNQRDPALTTEQIPCQTLTLQNCSKDKNKTGFSFSKHNNSKLISIKLD